jgi:hypothetical protein
MIYYDHANIKLNNLLDSLAKNGFDATILFVYGLILVLLLLMLLLLLLL